jgi:hypothetical protein
MITEGQFHVIKTMESCFVVLNYYENGSIPHGFVQTWLQRMLRAQSGSLLGKLTGVGEDVGAIVGAFPFGAFVGAGVGSAVGACSRNQVSQ